MGVYQKLGFDPLFPEGDPRHSTINEYGLKACPMVFNLSRMMFFKAAGENSSGYFSKLINRYLAERWYKRAVIRYYWRAKRHPWECSLEDMRLALSDAPLREQQTAAA
jgi:hypothetical protein